MSDQMVPPPPPPSNMPPPPGGGFDANAAVDQFKGADPLDLAVVGAGVLVFILSFFHWFSWSMSAYGYSVSGGYSAWHGFFSWAGVLLLLAAAAVTSLKIVKIDVPNQDIIVAGTSVVGALFVFLALFVYPGSGIGGIGHGWAYWASLILALARGLVK